MPLRPLDPIEAQSLGVGPVPTQATAPSRLRPLSAAEAQSLTSPPLPPPPTKEAVAPSAETPAVHPLLAAGVRALSGILSAGGYEEGPIAPAISGAGEALAEMLEKGKYDTSALAPGKIATEAAFGLVPFGKIVRGGEVGLSALRSGALGAAHQATSEAVGGQDPLADIKGLLMAGGTGALGGAIGSKFFGGTPGAPKPEPLTVVPTDQTITPYEIKRSSYGNGQPVAPPAQEIRTPEEVAADLARYQGQTPILGAFSDEPTRASARRSIAAEAKAAQVAASPAQQTGQTMPPPVPGPETTPRLGSRDIMGPATPENPLTQIGTATRPGGWAGFLHSLAKKAGAEAVPSVDESRIRNLLATGKISPQEAEAQLTQLNAPQAPGPVEPGVPPAAGETSTPGGGPESPAPSTSAVSDWAKDESDVADTLNQLKQQGVDITPEKESAIRRLIGGESGSMMLEGLTGVRRRRAVGALIGAALGTPIGAMADTNDPMAGGLSGLAIGGMLGAGTIPQSEDESLLNNITNWRNTSLLAGPAQLKKVLGDLGGTAFEGVKRMLTPGEFQTGANIFKEMGRIPTNVRTYARGLGSNPDIGTSIGDVVRAASQSPLGWVTRPFNAAMYMTQEMLKRAGVTDPDVIQRIMGTNLPETEAGKWWYQGQQYPIVRFLRPFAKIATNIAEGVRNVPGIGQVAGAPEDRLQRQIIGGLQMGLGAAAEAHDQSTRDQGEAPSTLSGALEAAAMGPRGVAPYALGKGLMAVAEGGPARALAELVRLIPGSQAILPAQFPNESADSYAKRVLYGPITQMAPSVFLPESGSAR